MLRLTGKIERHCRTYVNISCFDKMSIEAYLLRSEARLLCVCDDLNAAGVKLELHVI